MKTHSSKEFFFAICNFFLFLILQNYALGVTNLSPPIHQSSNILVVFLVSQNVLFLFCKKMLSPMSHLLFLHFAIYFAKKCSLILIFDQCLTSHPSEQCFFLQFALLFLQFAIYFLFFYFVTKMLSPMSHLPSIRAVGAVVTDVIAPTGNWLLHSLI